MPSDLQSLLTQETEANIANVPNIDRLTQLVSDINQRAYLSAPGRQQQLGVIQNMLAGNLDPQTIQENQIRAAQQYGGRGFGVDSGAWQSAISRATALDRQAMQERGATAANALYAGMPQANAQTYTATPELAVTYQNNRAAQAHAAAALREQARQFNITAASTDDRFTRELAQRASEAAMNAAQANAALAEKQREFDVSQSYTAAHDIAVLQENARQANQQADLTRTELANRQSQFTAAQAQQQNQFASTLAQRQSEFGSNLAQEQAALYAKIYGSLPGYNQFGVYTGQEGVFPAGGFNESPFGLPQIPTYAAPTRTATTRTTAPKVTPAAPASLFNSGSWSINTPEGRSIYDSIMRGMP